MNRGLEIVKNMLVITAILGLLSLSFYIGVSMTPYFGFGDIVDAVTDAFKNNLVKPWTQTAKIKFRSAFSKFGFFASSADLRLAIIGVLIGLVTQGGYGEKFLGVYSGMFVFLRFFTGNWTAAEWSTVGVAVTLDLIPVVDVNLWPFVVQFLLYRQMLFALVGYFVGAFASTISNYGEAASWIQYTVRIATVILMGYTIIDPFIHAKTF